MIMILGEIWSGENITAGRSQGPKVSFSGTFFWIIILLMDKNADLDATDRRILARLQTDCSLSIQEIADQVGLSANPCWRRIKRMEASGVIEGRVALINAAAVGLGTTVFVTIRTNRHDADWLEMFGRGVQLIPELVECHRLSGEIDYLLKVVVRDIEHYDQVYQKLITAIPGLADVSSAFSMERVKHSTCIDLTTT